MNRAKTCWLTLSILALALNACGESAAASPSTLTAAPSPHNRSPADRASHPILHIHSPPHRNAHAASAGNFCNARS